MTGRRGFSRKTIEDKVKRNPEYAARLRKVLSEDIGEALREARNASGLSQKAVAERMGVSESRVTQIEGEAGSSITLRTLRRFASAVGCRLDINLVDVATNQTVSSVLVIDDLAAETPAPAPAAWSEAVVTTYRAYTEALLPRIVLQRPLKRHQTVTVHEAEQSLWLADSPLEIYARPGV